MEQGLPRYEFSERLAEILGESRRDLRFRVTLMVGEGLVAPGPRGRGSPLATPQYAASLLLGSMAAPQQADTVEAIRCYSALEPTVQGIDVAGPRIDFGPGPRAVEVGPLPEPLALSEKLRFGGTLTRLLELARAEETRAELLRDLFGVWVSRGCPVAGVQFTACIEGRRNLVTQRFELSGGTRPPAWLDPAHGGNPDPGLYHTVFLPVSKLVQIGMLTTLPHDRRPPMLKNLGARMAALANMTKLPRQPRFRRRWEQLLATLATVKAWSDKVDSQASRLIEVGEFGSNPGNLRMFAYVPADLPPAAPLVVLLHGCTQSAASYDKGSGWSTLADRHGFALLLPQQSWKNNPLRCFNWFRPEDITRDSGEAQSIKQMVDRLLADRGLDARRVYVTGLSSGGAMTSVMLATYPEVFAGGAVLAGVPYGAANGLQEAFESIFQGKTQSAKEWGDKVRAASSHRGPWPKVSVWHGDADKSVKPSNAEDIVLQWADVHGIDSTRASETIVAGYPRRVWKDAEGRELVESYTISGMAHGAAVHPGEGEAQCGTAAPFFNDVGISSTHRIATFWGLTQVQRGTEAKRATPRSTTSDDATAKVSSRAQTDRAADAASQKSCAPKRESEGAGAQPDSRAEGAGGGQGSAGLNVEDLVAKSLELAGLLKGRRGGVSDARKPGKGSLGIDVHGIIATSLEAAGLLKGSSSAGTSSREPSSVPLGIDIPKIIATALEAAGVMGGAGDAASSPSSGGGALAGSGWQGEGWELVRNEPISFRGGPLLHGQVTSGANNDVGRKVAFVSRSMTIGDRPELSYVRRLALSASVNAYTSASFRVLVDGVAVDEVTAVGMVHSESEWTRRAGIDLARFANRTVTLTFEIVANSNVYKEVSAQAWVEEIAVENVVATSET